MRDTTVTRTDLRIFWAGGSSDRSVATVGNRYRASVIAPKIPCGDGRKPGGSAERVGKWETALADMKDRRPDGRPITRYAKFDTEEEAREYAEQWLMSPQTEKG